MVCDWVSQQPRLTVHFHNEPVILLAQHQGQDRIKLFFKWTAQASLQCRVWELGLQKLIQVREELSSGLNCMGKGFGFLGQEITCCRSDQSCLFIQCLDIRAAWRTRCFQPTPLYQNACSTAPTELVRKVLASSYKGKGGKEVRRKVS